MEEIIISKVTGKPIDFEERKKNPTRVIRHGLKSVSCYCRCCKFRIYQESNSNVMQKVRSHVNSTGHTVDIYRESQTEVTKYKSQ